jgi:hypothetical protein
VKSAHEKVLNLFPGSGSTFLWAGIKSDNHIVLAGLGDSFLWVFQKKNWPFSGWYCVLELERHIDLRGFPTQLVGAEVYQGPCVSITELKRDTCIVMMSDGAAQNLNTKSLTRELKLLNAKSKQADLDYLASVIAQNAVDAGSHDDISVALILGSKTCQ